MARQAFHQTSGLAARCLFNGSDTALRDQAFPPSETKPQVVSEAKDHFRKDDDMRWLRRFADDLQARSFL